MKKVFLYISDQVLNSKFENDLLEKGVKVVTISEQSLEKDHATKLKHIIQMIEEYNATHIESFYRYLEADIFKISQDKGVKMLSSFYDAVPLGYTYSPRHIGIGEVVGLNKEPEIDEGDVTSCNIVDNYIPHFA